MNLQKILMKISLIYNGWSLEQLNFLIYSNYIGEKLDLVREFFQYFRNTWGPESHIANWFEGANPYNISHNQGIESKNGCIKKDYTFRDRLDTADFFIQADKICRDDSCKDDSILFGPRVNCLKADCFGNIADDSFRIQEAGYQYYHENIKKLPSGRRKVNKIVEVKPDGKYTLCEENGIGKVDKMYLMSSSQNNETLESIAKKRIEARNNTVMKSLDEYKRVRNSCHIIESKFGLWYTSCILALILQL